MTYARITYKLPTLLTALLLVVVGFVAAQDGDATVVQLGDQTISEAEFDERFALTARNIASQQGIPFNTETQALFDSLRPQYLEQVATELVLLQEAETRGISVSDEEVETQVSQVRENTGGEEAFSQFLTETGFDSEDAFRQYIRDNLTIQALVDELSQDIEVGDEEVQSFYAENEAEIGQPLEEVRPAVEQAVTQQALNDRIAELRSAAGVEVFPENLTPLNASALGGETGGMETGGMETGGMETGGETGAEIGPATDAVEELPEVEGGETGGDTGGN